MNINPISLTLCTKEYNWEYNNSCNSLIPVGESVSFDLITIPKLEFDFLICVESQLPNPTDDFEFDYACDDNYKVQYYPTGENADATMVFEKLGNFDFDICADTQNPDIGGDYEYHTDDTCVDEYRPEILGTGENANADMVYSSLFIEMPGKAGSELDLNNCTPITTLDLGLCTQPLEISGKNKQYNFTMCSGETNPEPIDIDPHDFGFNRPWDYLCDTMVGDVYTGEFGYATLQGAITLPLSRNFTGESADVVNMVLAIQFEPYVYTGELVVKDEFLETNPAEDFEADADTGESADADLFREIEFKEVYPYSGESADGDLEINLPDIMDHDQFTGEIAEGTLIGSSVLFPNFQYTGESGDGDLLIDPLVNIGEPLAESGEFAYSDLLDNPSSEMIADVYTGEAFKDYTMNTTKALYPDVYTGEFADVIKLSINTTLQGDAESGENADSDLETFEPDELEPFVETGEMGDTDLAVSLLMFPRTHTGESVYTDLEIIPFIPWDWGSMYSGESVLVTELVEQTQYAIARGGESADVISLQTVPSFYPIALTGENGYSLISTSIGFNVYADTGESGLVESLYVTPGQEFEAEMLSGELGQADTNILNYPIFRLNVIISSQTMYDGLGGAGGLNFCPDDCCDSVDDAGYLIFDARPSDRPSYGQCGPYESTEMIMNLTCGVRFDAEAYTGESGIYYIDREYLPFGDMPGSCDDYQGDDICSPDVCYYPQGVDPNGDPCIKDDLYWLYNEAHPPVLLRTPVFEPVASSGEFGIVWWEDKDDFLSLMTQQMRVDLVVSNFGDVYTGEKASFDLQIYEADWKYPFRQTANNFQADFNFEANEYFRFCPGYLIPEGDNVIFEFASPIFLDCFGYFGKTGESVSDLELVTISGPRIDQYSGESAKASLHVVGPWLLKTWVDMRAEADLIVTQNIFPNIYTGEQGRAKFPDRKVLQYSGEWANLAELAQSLPSVKWVTESGCISNIYNPLTPDGDYDHDYENYDRCVEFMPYFGRVVAECTDEFVYYIHLLPETMGNNMEASASMARQPLFDLKMYTGESLSFQEYIAETGESIELDLETFQTIPLELELIKGDQRAYATINLPNRYLEPLVETGEIGDGDLEINDLTIVKKREPMILEFG